MGDEGSEGNNKGGGYGSLQGARGFVGRLWSCEARWNTVGSWGHFGSLGALQKYRALFLQLFPLGTEILRGGESTAGGCWALWKSVKHFFVGSHYGKLSGIIRG